MSKTYTKDEVKTFIKKMHIPWPFLMNRAILNRHRKKRVDLKDGETYTDEDIKKILGWRQLKAWKFDYFDGYLIDYCWLKSEKGQSGFMPINNNLMKIKKELKQSNLDLDNIYRRLTYFVQLENVLNFWQEKYDWDNLPIAFEYYLNIFETYISQMVHISLFFLELYYEQSKIVIIENKPKRYEDLVDAFQLIEQKQLGFQSLNSTLYIIALSEIRNQIIHSSKIEVKREGQESYITIGIPHKKRKGLFNKYLHELFENYSGKLICDSFLEFEDVRFPEYNFKFRVTKKATLDTPNSIVIYKSSLKDVIKQCSTQLFFIAKWSTDQLITELQS